MRTGLFFTGWRKVTDTEPEHEVDFNTVEECAGYLRQELVWLAMDCEPSDSVGDDAMGIAKQLHANDALFSSFPKEWQVGDHVYFIRKNKDELRRRLAGL